MQIFLFILFLVTILFLIFLIIQFKKLNKNKINPHLFNYFKEIESDLYEHISFKGYFLLKRNNYYFLYGPNLAERSVGKELSNDLINKIHRFIFKMAASKPLIFDPKLNDFNQKSFLI
jgi:hypothetical protein